MGKSGGDITSMEEKNIKIKNILVYISAFDEKERGLMLTFDPIRKTFHLPEEKINYILCRDLIGDTVYCFYGKKHQISHLLKQDDTLLLFSQAIDQSFGYREFKLLQESFFLFQQAQGNEESEITPASVSFLLQELTVLDRLEKREYRKHQKTMRKAFKMSK